MKGDASNRRHTSDPDGIRLPTQTFLRFDRFEREAQSLAAIDRLEWQASRPVDPRGRRVGWIIGGGGAILAFLVTVWLSARGVSADIALLGGMVSGLPGVIGWALWRSHRWRRARLQAAIREELMALDVPVCDGCGYCLRGLPPDAKRCPECGCTFDAAVAGKIRRQR